MEELLNILNDLKPDIDFSTEKNLIDGNLLDSLTLLMLISEIGDTFDISISPKWIKSENFNSAEAMWKMIRAIQEED